MIDGQVWGVYQQASIGPGKNHPFVGSYKLPLSQYTCIGLVVACSFPQGYDLGSYPGVVQAPAGACYC
jgi:hypothetical protein